MEISEIWTQMLGRRKPSKSVIKKLEEKMLSEIILSSKYVSERDNTILISYNNSIIAGLLPQNNYQFLIPWGNFKKNCSQDFWDNLTEKLLTSFNEKKDSSDLLISEKSLSIIQSFVKINESKSNRSSADYSEIMVVRDLCSFFNLPFNYSKDLKIVKSKVMSMYSGLDKIQTQDRNLPKLIEGCLQIISKENTLNEKIIAVDWIGREIDGTEDIEISLETRKIKISLKSIKKNGTGTLKNPGASTFKVLGIDYSDQYLLMNKAVVEGINNYFPHLNLSADTSLSEIKLLSKSNVKIKDIAEAISVAFIKNINSIILEGLKSSSEEDLKRFLNEDILDIHNNVWVCSVNEEGLEFWNQKEKFEVKDSDLISIELISDRSFRILKNNLPFVRANTCCTNGKGLSAICQRYFLDTSNEAVA